MPNNDKQYTNSLLSARQRTTHNRQISVSCMPHHAIRHTCNYQYRSSSSNYITHNDLLEKGSHRYNKALYIHLQLQQFIRPKHAAPSIHSENVRFSIRHLSTHKSQVRTYPPIVQSDQRRLSCAHHLKGRWCLNTEWCIHSYLYKHIRILSSCIHSYLCTFGSSHHVNIHT